MVLINFSCSKALKTKLKHILDRLMQTQSIHIYAD